MSPSVCLSLSLTPSLTHIHTNSNTHTLILFFPLYDCLFTVQYPTSPHSDFLIFFAIFFISMSFFCVAAPKLSESDLLKWHHLYHPTTHCSLSPFRITCKIILFNLKFWIFSIRPGMIPGSVMKETTIHTVIPLPNNTDQIFVCLKSSQAYLMTPQGQVVRTYSSGTYSTSMDQILYHLISFDSSI